MSDPFVGEVRMFTGNFAPTGWAFCNGQLLPLSQNTALFSLLGTTYGGDGKTTFALPNLQGRMPIGSGQGPGLTGTQLGEATGTATVTLSASEMPAHQHAVQTAAAPDSRSPSALAFVARTGDNSAAFRAPNNPAAVAAMAPGMAGVSGSGLPHNNLPPVLAVNFIIALQGVYPPRP